MMLILIILYFTLEKKQKYKFLEKLKFFRVAQYCRLQGGSGTGGSRVAQVLPGAELWYCRV